MNKNNEEDINYINYVKDEYLKNSFHRFTILAFLLTINAGFYAIFFSNKIDIPDLYNFVNKDVWLTIFSIFHIFLNLSLVRIYRREHDINKIRWSKILKPALKAEKNDEYFNNKWKGVTYQTLCIIFGIIIVISFFNFCLCLSKIISPTVCVHWVIIVFIIIASAVLGLIYLKLFNCPISSGT